MPFYEYECGSCGFCTEVLQKISDPQLRKCPSCGKSAFKRLMSAPVFRLKGSGWYETDFKSDKDNKRNLAGADKDDSAPVEKKIEAKPADAAVDSKKAEPAPKADAAAPPAAKTESSKSARKTARGR